MPNHSTPLATMDPASDSDTDSSTLRSEKRACHIIVVGNEKGGAGKSTIAMHLSVALLRMGRSVGVIDLDVRQKSYSRYYENRAQWIADTQTDLPMPVIDAVRKSERRNLDDAEKEEKLHITQCIAHLGETCDFILIDAPGGDTFLSRRAHAHADTLITPLNDSYVDFDLLGEIDPATLEVRGPRCYSELVWESRKEKALARMRPLDWVVMRNRMSPLAARNKFRVGKSLQDLSQRIGFRIAPGMSERVIYRELFPMGLTLLDLTEDGSHVPFSLSHVAARQELRDLLSVLKLPGIAGMKMVF